MPALLRGIVNGRAIGVPATWITKGINGATWTGSSPSTTGRKTRVRWRPRRGELSWPAWGGTAFRLAGNWPARLRGRAERRIAFLAVARAEFDADSPQMREKLTMSRESSATTATSGWISSPLSWMSPNWKRYACTRMAAGIALVACRHDSAWGRACVADDAGTRRHSAESVRGLRPTCSTSALITRSFA